MCGVIRTWLRGGRPWERPQRDRQRCGGTGTADI